MEKRCLKCGIMITVPDMDNLNPDNRADVVCPKCGEKYLFHMGQLKRPRPQYDLGIPESRIEKRKYAPIQVSVTTDRKASPKDEASPQTSDERPLTDTADRADRPDSAEPSGNASDEAAGAMRLTTDSELERQDLERQELEHRERSGNRRDPFAVPGPEDKHRGFFRKLFGW